MRLKTVGNKFFSYIKFIFIHFYYYFIYILYLKFGVIELNKLHKTND